MTPLERLTAALPDEGDAFLVLTPQNRRYLTGFASTAGGVLVTRRGACFYTDSRYLEGARRAVAAMEVVPAGAKLSDTLRGLFARFGVTRVRLEEEITCATLRRLRETLLPVEWVCDGEEGGLSGLLQDLRRTKSRAEVAGIRAAQSMAERGLMQLLPALRAGQSEREIALELEFAVRRLGAEGVAFPFIVVSGENSSMPHATPGDRLIQPGDFLTMDFGVTVDGWHSDMTRTVAVGQPTEEMRLVYDTVLAAQRAALAALRPGLSCVEGDRAARSVIERAGYGAYFGHGTGHGVGLDIHEAPTLSAHAGEDALRPGDVVTVEPGIYLPGRFGVRIEDMAYITGAGCENLTVFEKELVVVG